MARDYRESVINLQHDDGMAHIWTDTKGLAARLLRLGWIEEKRQGKGVWMSAPIKAVSFRNVRSIGTRKGNMANLRGDAA